jgi:hypothetical protein
MAIYSGFSHIKWWFSIAMLNYQRVKQTNLVDYWGYLPCWETLCLGVCLVECSKEKDRPYSANLSCRSSKRWFLISTFLIHQWCAPILYPSSSLISWFLADYPHFQTQAFIWLPCVNFLWELLKESCGACPNPIATSLENWWSMGSHALCASTSKFSG